MLLLFLSVSALYCSHIFLYLGCSVWRSTSFLHGSIRARQLVRFGFCWRALNRWPILKGPLCLPLSSCEQISSSTTRWRQSSRPIPSSVQNTLPSCVFCYVNHRRASCTPSREEISNSKHTAPTLPPLLVSYHILSIELQLLLAQREGTVHLLPVSTWCWGQLPIDLLPGTAPVTDGLWPRSF